MGMLVRNWIINKLGLPVPEYSDAADFRTGLSNGFVIAEILRKYSVISDDQLVTLGHHRHNFSEATKVKNMTLVHRWMIGAGIQGCDLSELLDVAEEKPGAVVRLLYKLYFTLEGTSQVNEFPSEAFDYDLGTRPSVSAKHKFFTQNQNFDYATDSNNISEYSEMQQRLQQAQEEDDETNLEIEINAEQDGEGYEEQEAVPSTRKNYNNDPFLSSDSDSDIAPPAPRCISRTNLPSQSSDPLLHRVLDNLVEQRLEECPLITPAMVGAAYKLPDSREATKVYFANQSIQQVKQLPQLKKKNKDGQEDIADLIKSCQRIDFSSIASESERLNLQKMKAKVEQEYRLAKEMGSYDSMLDEVGEAEDKLEEEQKRRKQRMTDLLSNMAIKIHPRDAQPIKPSPIAMKMRLNRLKCTRKEEEVASEERGRLRRSLAASMIKNISLQIHEDLVETVLKATTSISGQEAELCDFFRECYKPKEIFLDHIRHEGEALSSIRIQRSERVALDKERKAALEAQAANLDAQRKARIEDSKRDTELALLLHRIILPNLNFMIRLAMRIGDYRELTGEDPSEEQIEEWKAWLMLGLESPPEPDSDSEMEFDLKDGNCHIVLSEYPIPTQLNPNAVKTLSLEREADEQRKKKKNKSSKKSAELQLQQDGEEEEEEQQEEAVETMRKSESNLAQKGKKKNKGQKSKKSAEPLADGGDESEVLGQRKSATANNAKQKKLLKSRKSETSTEAEGQKQQKGNKKLSKQKLQK